MALHQCLFCKRSFRSDEERKEHEEVCAKNGKTERERFEAKTKLKSTKAK